MGLTSISATDRTADASDSGDGCNHPDDQGMAVLRLLSLGLTDDVIARRLCVSLRTERRIITSLMDVMAVRSRFQLGQEAARRGYV